MSSQTEAPTGSGLFFLVPSLLQHHRFMKSELHALDFLCGRTPGTLVFRMLFSFFKLRGLVLIFLRGMSLQPCDLPRGRPILSVSHTQRKLYKPLLRILQTQPVHAQKNTARCNGCPLVPIRTSVFLAKDAMSAAACGMSGETSRLSQIAWGRATAD